MARSPLRVTSSVTRSDFLVPPTDVSLAMHYDVARVICERDERTDKRQNYHFNVFYAFRIICPDVNRTYGGSHGLFADE